MRKLLYICIFCIFIIRKDVVVESALIGLNIWIYKLFPLLFPTFIISDLLLSSDLPIYITSKFGKLYRKIFKNNKYGLYIFLISMIAGTPANSKSILLLKDNKVLNDKEINKMLSSSILFNPLLIISLGGIKLFIILLISNLITGIIFRNISIDISDNEYNTLDKFNINESINKNINLIFNILGTVVLYSIIINIIPLNNVYFGFILNSLLELSNALNYVSLFFENNLTYLAIVFSMGGLSILTQIKSILKDTFINYKLIILSRLVCTCVSVVICWIT